MSVVKLKWKSVPLLSLPGLPCSVIFWSHTQVCCLSLFSKRTHGLGVPIILDGTEFNKMFLRHLNNFCTQPSTVFNLMCKWQHAVTHTTDYNSAPVTWVTASVYCVRNTLSLSLCGSKRHVNKGTHRGRHRHAHTPTCPSLSLPVDVTVKHPAEDFTSIMI